MFKNLKEKAKKFWYNNKTKIIAVATGVAAVGGVVLLVYTGKKNMDLKLQEEAIEKERKDAEQKAEWDAEWEQMKNDPARKLAHGGWVTESYDIGDACEDGYEIQEFIINDLPLENLGVFGEDMVARMKEMFPDLDDTDLGSIIIDMYTKKPSSETGDAA